MTDAPDHPDRTASALSHLGGLVGRHPRTVVIVWLLAVVAAFGGATGAFGNQSLFDRLQSGDPAVAGENLQGRDQLVAAGRSATSTHLLQVTGADAAAPTTVAAVKAAAADLGRIPGVVSVAAPQLVPAGIASPEAKALLPTSGDGFAAVVTFDPSLKGDARDRTQEQVDTRLRQLVAAVPGAKGTTGGLADLIDAITSQVEKDLRAGEGIALPISFLVMVLVFGGFIAAGMPIVGAIASIGGALASLLAFSHLIDLDATVVNVVTVLGLGLCIDYGLLTVSRFREELRSRVQGRPAAEITREEVQAAIARTVDSAGRTVVFSGLTVAISLGGLLVFEASILKAIGSAGLSVVLVAMLVALTLVPALCVLGARRLLARGTEQAPEEGVFSRLATGVFRRPVLVILAVLVVLGTLAAPAFQLKLTSSGKELLPVSAPQRQFFTQLEQRYPQLSGPDLQVVAQAPLARAQEYAAALPVVDGQHLEGRAERVTDTLSLVSVEVPGGPLGDTARHAVTALKAERPDFPTKVIGQASGLRDFTDSLRGRAPYAFALVALATLVLLFLMTGSVVIPVKALLMNVVSLGASLGVVVWVFQQGHLEGVLGFDSVGAIESTIPLLVLAFGFGLSMDYEVFLLSRIVELHERGVDNDRAVIAGLQRSGRIITSAALLVVIVFSGFVSGRLLVIKETGVGLAVAVLLDATLVRMLLVPATMKLLGSWNWWAPPALRRWHARFGITE
ncbi:MMPL family transporter [Phycicoccus sp. Soil748]|uniref:MMPL family transporter n=1 Tax=Phycicoccus sp. Soil748 TaxID=1736397 RepID=UPI0007026476|nr:MMPL family transporter [Phycicoccus sp. Soil748]KRE57782.1 multidrug RND transporter [Phycicoccus sp. Soil748]